MEFIVLHLIIKLIQECQEPLTMLYILYVTVLRSKHQNGVLTNKTIQAEIYMIFIMKISAIGENLANQIQFIKVFKQFIISKKLSLLMCYHWKYQTNIMMEYIMSVESIVKVYLSMLYTQLQVVMIQVIINTLMYQPLQIYMV